ncbi:MAG: CocE/NonD family hydrolase, partial [Bacteroides sp.]
MKEHYVKREVMIPMRDGVRLFTAVYEPISKGEKHPILITRTPYQAGPYGKKINGQLWGSWSEYTKEQYVFVIQDVRGRWMSEGTFVDVRPFNAHKQGKKE